MFSGVAPKQARAYLHRYLSAARGTYSRLIVPRAGRFDLPITGTRAGYKPEQIFTSDNSLLPTLIGTLAAGRDPRALNISLNLTEPPALIQRFKTTDNPFEYVSCVIFAMRLVSAREGNPCKVMLKDELLRGWERHLGAINAGVVEMVEALKGCSYTYTDPLDHLLGEAQNPHSLVILDLSVPPSKIGGSAITWDQPPGRRLKAKDLERRVQEAMLDKPAMVLVLLRSQDIIAHGGHAVWAAPKDPSHDPTIKRRRLQPIEVKTLLRHTYRMLLTWGMKGTIVYSTDPETLEMLHSLLG